MLKLSPIYSIKCNIKLVDGRIIEGNLLTGDTYLATGTVIAITAKYLLENTVVAGAYSLHEAIPSEVIINQLLAENIIQISTTTHNTLTATEAI